MNDGPCCAHINVVRLRDEKDGRVSREWWACKDCNAEFTPSSLADTTADRAYIAGMKTGWNYGVTEDRDAFNALIESRAPQAVQVIE